jgi:hypothetical protein
MPFDKPAGVTSFQGAVLFGTPSAPSTLSYISPGTLPDCRGAQSTLRMGNAARNEHPATDNEKGPPKRAVYRLADAAV